MIGRGLTVTKVGLASWLWLGLDISCLVVLADGVFVVQWVIYFPPFNVYYNVQSCVTGLRGVSNRTVTAAHLTAKGFIINKISLTFI